MPLTRESFIEPPTHRIDAEGVWIHFSDPAYDRKRVESEIAEMQRQRSIAAKQLEEELEKARDRKDVDLIAQLEKDHIRLPAIYGMEAHPMVRYYAGRTRYDLHAEMRIPRAEGDPVIVTAAEYFGPDARKFRLSRLSRAIWREVEQEAFSDVASRVLATGAKLDHQALAELSVIDQYSRQKGREKAVRYGLLAVDGVRLPKEKDHAGRDVLVESALDQLHQLDPGLIDLLAKAVIVYSQPLREDEFLAFA